MENFEYSVQLSDQDWAEFLAATNECGLLQADLASGDELLSSDIDQGDSSGGSPPGPPPLLRPPALGGRGRPGCQEICTATRPPASRLPCEPGLAPGASQQTPGTSAWPGARQPPGFSLPGQSASLSEPAFSRDEMQRLLQGPLMQGTPSPAGETAPHPEGPGRTAAAQERPGRKKRAAGARRGGRAGAPAPGASLPAALLGKGPAGATAELMAGAKQDKLEPDPPQAPDPVQVLQQELGLDLSTPVRMTEPGTDLVRLALEAELHAVSTPAQEPQPEVAQSTPAQELQPKVAQSTPAWEPQPKVAQSTPISKPNPDVAVSTPGSKPQPEVALLTPISKLQLSGAPSIPNSKPNADVGLSTLVPMFKPDVGSTAPISMVMPQRALPCCVSQATSDVGVSIPGHRTAVAALPATPSRGCLEGPSAEQPPGPTHVPRRKRVRFSVAEPGPEQLASGEAVGPRMAVGGRGGPGAWDAVAIGPRTLQPRVHQQLPPPAPSSSRGPRSGGGFALTLPEAYDFLFCDTIEEEVEEVEEAEEVAEEALANVQWPDSCEFFFRDCPAPRGCSPAAAALLGDPVPLSLPEAYEHFFGKENPARELEPAAETVRAGPPRVGRWAGEPRGPLASFALSQDDMCLVFVAFATWAVRTSDLHAPDAWKTVLLANIGTISAIRCFRRQVDRGRPGAGP